MATGHSRRTVLSGTVSGGIGLVSGCLSGSTEEPTTAADEPITIALEEDPTDDSWDTYGYVTPYFTKVLEPLVWVTDEMEPEPWLATEWDAVDETTWEFSLREDVQFHNGEPLTADDVVWSFDQLFDRGEFVYGWLHLAPENVEAVDDHTVSFTNTEPFPAFPGTIAHNMVCVQHPDSDADEFGAIGTGPLEIESVDRGSSVEVVPFGEYWGEPMASSLRFEALDNPNTRVLALEGGDIDVIFNPPRSRVETLRQDSELTVLEQQSPRATSFLFNLHRELTDDLQLRKAMNYALSQETLVNSVLEGVDEPATGPISPTVSWSAHDEVPTYERDHERARELVAESGYDGEELMFAVNEGTVDGELLAEVAQNEWEAVGIDTEIRVIDSASFNDFIEQGEANVWLHQSGSNSAAADYIMFENFHSEGIRSALRYEDDGTGVSNPGGEVDELIEAGYQSRDGEETADAYREAQVQIQEQAVTVPVCYNVYTLATKADVSGIDPHTIDKLVDWTDVRRET